MKKNKAELQKFTKVEIKNPHKIKGGARRKAANQRPRAD